MLASVVSGIVRPNIIFIVDASDSFEDLTAEFPNVRVNHVHSKIKSAASQRNIGIELSLKANINFDFIAFLDDDTLVDHRYFADILQRFKENLDFVGISGIAINKEIKHRQRSKITEILGITGEAGSITKSLVNISPEGISSFGEVQWLIGCSVWRRCVVEQILFESDFSGQSLFEDVIFSYRAGRIGKLGVDPKLRIVHTLSEIGRPDSRKHAFFWVINRYRLFQYSKNEFSRRKFWILNLTLLIVSAIRGIAQTHQRARARGIFGGVLVLLKRRIP
jgi:GT2 family glycosyltransferase